MINKATNEQSITLGVCYYPEHWPETLWTDDFKRMKELGFQYVRMAEFAWTIFEPSEGQFTFDLFDRAIDLAGEEGLKVILGTPTATPPVWLTEKYPEVLNASMEGVIYRNGARRHYNYNSLKYHELSAKIVKKMVEHYKDNEIVVGWQLDNEFNCEMDVFYSEADHTQFRKWAKNKYRTLDYLNKAWGTVFWNQTYTSWDQVYLSRPTVSQSHNPHQSLDEKRFISDSVIRYAQMQADIIRAHTSKQWITTNGMFDHLNNHELTNKVLDFYSYDSYPNFSKVTIDSSKKALKDRRWSLNLSTVRNFGGNFAVFEQQAGPGGWVNRMEQPTPYPGQLRLWTYQSLAHGADMILYFRWRTATQGSEIYWHGINDYHNIPNRRIAEIEQTTKEINSIGNELVNSNYFAKAAILMDYSNEWDGEMDKWYGDYNWSSKESWFKAFQYNHIPVDIFNVNQETILSDIQNYEVVIYPHAAILTEHMANILKKYVEQGGQIVFGCRTGYKDERGQTYMKALPGYVADLVGVTVEDFTLLPSNYDTNVEVTKVSIRDQEIELNGFNDILHVEDENVEVLGTFKDAYYEGKPAFTKRKHGKGSAYYFGGVFDVDIADVILNELDISDYSDLFQLPESIELAVRKKDHVHYYILLNYSQTEQNVTVNKQLLNLFNNEVIKGDVILQPYDVITFKEEVELSDE